MHWNHKKISLPRRQVRALLYRLAIERRPVSRDHLCYLFWPDEAQSVARRRLTHLQTHLEEALPVSGSLVRTNDYISLNHNIVWSDVIAFEKLTKCTLDQKPHDLYQHASQLYQGVFLDGFTAGNLTVFEDWVRQHQMRLERKYLLLLEKLISHFTEIQDYKAAIRCSQSYLEIDNLAEQICRRLIELLVMTGSYSKARKQLAICEQVIQVELGQPLHPDTISALTKLLESLISSSSN